jgi:hypothetical protein
MNLPGKTASIHAADQLDGADLACRVSVPAAND